jgi:hypothetical protein
MDSGQMIAMAELHNVTDVRLPDVPGRPSNSYAPGVFELKMS